MQISTAWTAGMSPEEREAFLPVLQNNTRFIQRFLEVLEAKLETLERREVSEEHFSEPDWACREAFLLGKRQALNEIRNLFNYDR